MDIAELANRIGLSTRRLRYVFDHKLLPGWKKNAPGRGIPRSFTNFEAFAIAIAGLLLEAGFKKTLVETCIEGVINYKYQEGSLDNVPLYQAYRSENSHLELGDGVNYRLHAKNQFPKIDIQTDWISLAGGYVVPRDYEPLVKVVIDLSALRRRIV